MVRERPALERLGAWMTGRNLIHSLPLCRPRVVSADPEWHCAGREVGSESILGRIRGQEAILTQAPATRMIFVDTNIRVLNS